MSLGVDIYLFFDASRYDQRQDGDSNVDARLQNFFVVLAPSNMGQLGGASLLDLASKAVPLRLRPQAHADSLKQREEVDAEHGQVWILTNFICKK